MNGRGWVGAGTLGQWDWGSESAGMKAICLRFLLFYQVTEQIVELSLSFTLPFCGRILRQRCTIVFLGSPLEELYTINKTATVILR